MQQKFEWTATEVKPGMRNYIWLFIYLFICYLFIHSFTDVNVVTYLYHYPYSGLANLC